MQDPARRRLLALLLLALAALIPPSTHRIGAADAATAPAVDSKYLESLGIRYALEVKTEPRLMRIHRLTVDLAKARIELAAVPAEDPDGDGPALAKLEAPMSMAERSHAVALVNANRWQSLPDAEGKRHTDWREGLPIETLGMVIAGGKVIGRPDDRFCGFYVDRAGKCHVGNPPDAKDALEGVAGLPRLLEAGRRLPASKPDDPVHPRTAIGLDARARTLFIVVVDGRQEGYSMGMSVAELAEYMKGLGCTDAVNLDGGGSSILILGDAAGERRVVNDPSTKALGGKSVARPIPVSLVVRERT